MDKAIVAVIISRRGNFSALANNIRGNWQKSGYVPCGNACRIKYISPQSKSSKKYFITSPCTLNSEIFSRAPSRRILYSVPLSLGFRLSARLPQRIVSDLEVEEHYPFSDYEMDRWIGVVIETYQCNHLLLKPERENTFALVIKLKLHEVAQWQSFSNRRCTIIKDLLC